MLYQNSHKKRKKRLILGGAFFALFLVVYLIDGFPPAFLRKTFFLAVDPIVLLQDKVGSFFGRTISYFKNKSFLDAENIFLKEKIMELETRLQFTEVTETRNRELEEVFSIKGERNFVLASITARPGYGFYNELFVDSGLDSGFKEGAPVTAFGKILIGHIFEVGSSWSRVRLISFPGKETNVFIADKMAAITMGAGSENMEISLPSSVEVSVGEIVMTLEKNPLIVGYIEKIILEEGDSLQKIIFRLPLNIQQLHHVYIIK